MELDGDLEKTTHSVAGSSFFFILPTHRVLSLHRPILPALLLGRNSCIPWVFITVWILRVKVRMQGRRRRSGIMQELIADGKLKDSYIDVCSSSKAHAKFPDRRA